MRIVYEVPIWDQIKKAAEDAITTDRKIEKVILTRKEFDSLNHHCSYGLLGVGITCYYCGIRIEVESP